MYICNMHALNTLPHTIAHSVIVIDGRFDCYRLSDAGFAFSQKAISHLWPLPKPCTSHI